MSLEDSVFFGSIAEVGDRMAAGEFGPVALTEVLLRRIEASQTVLNSFITVTHDIALCEAEKAQAVLTNGKVGSGLNGVPLAYKDLLATKGVPTTFASRAYADWVPDYDATQVVNFRDAGAVMAGKVNLSEGAADSSGVSSAFGAPRNPWNSERITGGSSGGSAAAVAAGLAFGAIGSDTAMSIRHPAALCGIVGLKPTYGRVSKYGAMPLSFSLDHLGPMTRTVRDAALMLQIMAGHDPLDATTENRPVPDYVAAVAQAPTRLDGLRIGVPREPFFEDLAPGWDVIIESALMVFKAAGATVEELLLPHSADLNHVGSIIILAEGAAFHNEAYGRDSSKLGPGLRALVESGRQLSAVDFVQAQRIRRMLCQEALTAMAPYDALLLPTTPLPACLVSEDDPALVSQRYRNCLLFDVLSVPAISVP